MSISQNPLFSSPIHIKTSHGRSVSYTMPHYWSGIARAILQSCYANHPEKQTAPIDARIFPSAMLSCYSVNHWCSHPVRNQDDLDRSEDFSSLSEAIGSKLYLSAPCHVEFIEVDGPSHYEVRLNPSFNPSFNARQARLDDQAGRSEFACQQGMAFGCRGYNEAMGWD